MGISSFVDAASTWSSIPLAVAGFGVTIWQTIKAKKAAEMAQMSAQEATDRISRSSLLVLLPQLHRAEEQLERAVRDGSVELTISWLYTWRWQAGQVRGLLDESDPIQREMATSLQASISSATSAKEKLIANSSPDIVTATRTVRAAVGKVTGELGAMASSHGMQAGAP
ncbi:hypothetical protein ABT133_16380 [Streptomyces sp. NPDC001835]|uniref:hypothetical protein n=1 Tax=Streptomyces sp. NPDC001835 TaxID=3154528 RepID=UPI0033338241